MTNEVNTLTPVVATPRSLSLTDTKSAAPSESGKQVPPPGEAEPKTRSREAAASEEEVFKAAEKLSQHARAMGRELNFSVDKDSGQTVVKVIDPETDEVVRQIPSEEAVERAKSNDASDMNIVDDVV